MFGFPRKTRSPKLREQRAQHFSTLVGAQYGKQERLDCLRKTRSPKPRVAKGAALFQASWNSVSEARMLGFLKGNEVPEAAGSKGRSTLPG